MKIVTEQSILSVNQKFKDKIITKTPIERMKSFNNNDDLSSVLLIVKNDKITKNQSTNDNCCNESDLMTPSFSQKFSDQCISQSRYLKSPNKVKLGYVIN